MALGTELTGALRGLIGREDSNPWFASGPSECREEIRWIGKPWRRVELLTQRHLWKGEQTEVKRDLTFHLGCRRLGIACTFTVMRAPVLDYSEERQ